MDTSVKAIFAVLIWVIAVCGALLPLRVRENKRVMGLLNTASGGVFLSGGLVHLLPDATEILRRPCTTTTPTTTPTPFPLAPFLAAIGFLSVLYVEEVAHTFASVLTTHGSSRGGGEHSGSYNQLTDELISEDHLEESNELTPAADVANNSTTTTTNADGAELQACDDSTTEERYEEEAAAGGASLAMTSTTAARTDDRASMISAMSTGEFITAISSGELAGGAQQRSSWRQQQVPLENEFEQAKAEGEAVLEGFYRAGQARRASSFSSLILLAALSFHSFMEGLGLGANVDPYGPLVAVLSHKALAAYALGASMLSGGGVARSRFAACMCFFSMMTPLGMALGIVLGYNDTMAGGVCTALAAGTFMYVAICEVIRQELEDPSDRLCKLASLGAGFGLMSLLALWV